MAERNKFTPEQEEWLTALVSGEYQQGTKNLKVSLAGKCFHCCLGVACELAEKVDLIQVFTTETVDDQDRILYHYTTAKFMDDTTMVLPLVVADQLNMRSVSGHFYKPLARPTTYDDEVPDRVSDLVQLNDGWKYEFAQIVEFIRKNPWQVFKNFDVPESALRKVKTGTLFGQAIYEIACSDSNCPYQLGSYDQDVQRHREGNPRDHGLCLNCLDDMNGDAL